ncbi:MAG: uroporphyrinogen-III synthase [Rhodovibrio sp.]|nr:uroporphyrinogen-III synthase [Rhodovibrio sp.]
MRVLVTRPRADSEALVGALEARGHAAVVEPLLNIRVRDVDPDVSDVQALLITSANGVRAFAELSDERDLRVLTVGEASAEAARNAGFVGVESADGDAEALARLVIDRLDPADGPVYHAAGTVTAGALKDRLTAAGFEVRRTPLYEAVPAERLSAETRTALQEGALDAALFFSPRTAKVFVTLLYAEGIAHTGGKIRAICLSDAVASALRDAARQGRASDSDDPASDATPAGSAPPPGWADVRVAERPERQALLAALDAAAADAEAQRAERTRDLSAVRAQQSTSADGSPPSAPGAEPAPSKTAQAATKDAMTQQDKDDKTPSDPSKPDPSKPDPSNQDGPAGSDDTEGQGRDPAASAEAAEGADPQGGEAVDPSNNRALAVIQRFGGIRPMATKLGVAVSTVQGWKNRGAIPESRHDEILAAARSNNIDLDRAVLSASGEESVGSAEGQAGSLSGSPSGSPWGRPDDAPETVEAEEVPDDRDDIPDDAEVTETDAHAAGAEAEAASTAGPEVAAGPAGPRPRRRAGRAAGCRVCSWARRSCWSAPAGRSTFATSGSPTCRRPTRSRRRSRRASRRWASWRARSPTSRANWRPSRTGSTVSARPRRTPPTRRRAPPTRQSAAQRRAPRSGRSTAQQAADSAAAAGSGDGGGTGDGGAQVAQLRQQVDQLSSRLDQATNRLETLAGRVDAGASGDGGGGGGASAQRLDTLASRVDELSSQVEQLSQTAASRETAQSLADRLSALETQTQDLAARQQAESSGAAGGARPAAQALAVAELRDALRFSSPFAQQLQAARQVVGDDSALAATLDELQPMAAQGVPTRAELSSAFDRAAAGGRGGRHGRLAGRHAGRRAAPAERRHHRAPGRCLGGRQQRRRAARPGGEQARRGRPAGGGGDRRAAARARQGRDDGLARAGAQPDRGGTGTVAVEQPADALDRRAGR